MLLSPGHSPRQISSPSPSLHLSETPSFSNDSKSIVSSSSIPRRKRAKVLDEDTYVASIERIIERDFFPDITKLRDRLDWLEAVRTRDPVQIRDAQLKIIERRRGAAAGRSNSGAATGTKSQTPGSTFFRSSSFTPFDGDGIGPFSENRSEVPSFDNRDGGEAASEVDESLSLDEFLRRYTSEDNESFSQLLEKENRKREERYGYLLEGEKETDLKLVVDGKREKVVTDGYGTSDQPVSTLEGCKFTAKNLLMYHPADRGEAPLTEEERAHRLKGMTKEINMTNTRFRGKMLDYKEREDDTVEVLYTPVAGSTPLPMLTRGADNTKKYDLEDLRKTPNGFYVESGKKAENGYGFVMTPSPAPGADESPFITWGEIEGTPLRLEQEDTPIDIGGSGDGPHFNIPMPPLRDIRAHELSREASLKLKQRSRMFQKPPLHSPLRGGSASPSARLSPAAQKFVRKAIAKSSHAVDESLRASYRGSSPVISTPKSGRSISRFGRDTSNASRSPSVREVRNSPW